MTGQSGLERISSAPRLSFSHQDVFNLRNHNLSQLSRSTPGIYSPQRKALEVSQHKLNLTGGTPPKSILVKPKEEPVQEKNSDDEKEEKGSYYYSVRLELQFTAFVFLCFFIIVVIPLSMIIVGSAYMYSCPTQSMIPVFLVVGGAGFLSSIVVLRKLNMMSKKSDEDEECYKKIFLLVVLFHIGWFIAGCYWVYGAYAPNYLDESSQLYCHKTLYLYSFWLLNSIFLTLSLFAVLFTVYILFGREQNQEIGTKV
ncbi:uncharacterized protein LOC129958052 [Argiope bruennichi]|uniref:Uncharacterized protein n=1 Tax=Argiope bruennichi TaxID=94029 RepID=A0A8T0F0K0_ARGBR|nr:uncharacterized protein LOC129958052 [Argiope bruennichi]XP_055926184.1 uncharacterized protein LOC129958052 [Argiope bruennichi]KAF8784617.1 hypothetical protein HNY73_010269 [Argiope bruennichi]